MERTQTVAQGTRIRVAFSGSGALEQAHTVAAEVERILGTKGSALVPQAGRWDGISESGYVLDVVVEGAGNFPGEAERHWLALVGVVLQKLVASTGLTFYVTAEQVLAMEVF